MKKATILTGPTGIIDPPWDYAKTSQNEKLRGYSTGKEYESITTADLAKLPVASLMNYCFLWTTGPFCEDAFKLLRGWGFLPITMFPWVKCQEIYPEGIAFPPEYEHPDNE